MRLSRTWAWTGLAAAIAIVCASVPWSLDPDRLSARFNETAQIGDYRWEKPSRATLRVFPTPTMEVEGLRLVDASGAAIFEAPVG
jgi:hypothetical protein